MTKTHTIPVLAIDGGGTRCRLALHDKGNLVRVEAGSANVSTDFEAAIRQIRGGLATLCEEAGVSMQALCEVPAYAGLAGVTGARIADRVAASLPLQSIKVEDDRPSALRGAVGDREGFVAHCGTGSFMAARVNGVMRFAGGWGAVLGDPSSAQWVGRQSLARTLDVADGLAAKSELSEALLERFDGTAGIVAFAATASPAAFGGLAPAVTKAAAQGDVLARSILRDGAKGMAETMQKMGWKQGMAICLTGGIGPFFAEYMPEEMQVCLSERQGEPLDGALALAEEFGKEIADGRD
ncbi:glucosamine kinase [Shimia isoporae]|uniref:Glucosamine kinase n=1 Tax=Shimia isoporae TaxID=647720 RepID=A0A4R1N3R4_9RHOB|nr:BadF/BadG/BcrA/BcrD ATPase family protein [Shimia isoporae]TCL01175.1 glucosamine kinase [Shimia isoporae]